MYEFIEGIIVELTPTYAVIQTGGVGYFIHISLHTYTQFAKAPKPATPVLQKIYVFQVVREDALLLFGFFAPQERALFKLLITVSGIGANTGRMILSSLDPSELRKAIADGNVNVLKGIKGIGLKTAQRIILDLKDKIGIDGLTNENFLNANNTIKEEALSALVTLGFTKSLIEKMIDKQLGLKPDLTVEELIKQTLRNI